MTVKKRSSVVKRAEFEDKILQKVAEYSLDRLVWCIATIALCWTEVQNYHEYIFMLRMYILSGVGAFYCLKLGAFSKGKRLLCGVTTLVGACASVYMVVTNFYATYKYLNLPLGIFLTVLANLYALVIHKAIKKRSIPWKIGPSFVLVLMLLFQQTSVYDYKQFYLYMLISLLPFIMMKKGYRTRSCVLNGMLDGFCIGFFLIQGYAWMHRPYNYNDIRYTGIANACTVMSRIYLAYFTAWIIRYTQIAQRKLTVYNGIMRVFAWFMAAFVLALEYLTGSRSAVLAMILVTMIAVAARYLCVPESRREYGLKLVKWGINCAGIGVVSLLLFPIAYKSVRYLPAYFNDPVYVDSIGYRSDSIVIQKWGETFGWNYEYDDYTVKRDEDKNSPSYATFPESVTYSLGRIIPGAEALLEKLLAEELLESSLKRADYYFDQGIYTQRQYDLNKAYWSRRYAPAENGAGESGSKLMQVYRGILQKVLEILVLRADAEELALPPLDEEDILEIQMNTNRGETENNPWYTDEEFPGNGMALRRAIHKYAISKLNFKGHPDGSFEMWIKADDKQPHAHNIFLIMGYDFGVPSMLLMIILFGVTFWAAMRNVLRFGKVEYLLPALLIAGMTVFGWFESGFDYKTGSMMWILLCTIYTDVLLTKEMKIKHSKMIKQIIEKLVKNL